MNFWNAVVLVAAIIAVANIVMTKYRYQGTGKGAIDAPGTSPRELELERELAELKDRLHVLERIATDDRQSRYIAAEIESLRDK